MALETWILVCGEKHALLDPVRVKSKIHQTVPRGRMSWGLAYLLSARLVSEMKDSNEFTVQVYYFSLLSRR